MKLNGVANSKAKTNMTHVARGHSLKILELGEIDRYSKEYISSKKKRNFFSFPDSSLLLQGGNFNIHNVNAKSSDKKKFMNQMGQILLNQRYPNKILKKSDNFNSDKNASYNINTHPDTENNMNITLQIDELEELDDLSPKKVKIERRYSYINNLDNKDMLKGGSVNIPGDKFRLYKKKLTKKFNCISNGDSEAFRIISGDNLLNNVDPLTKEMKNFLINSVKGTSNKFIKSKSPIHSNIHSLMTTRNINPHTNTKFATKFTTKFTTQQFDKENALEEALVTSSFKDFHVNCSEEIKLPRIEKKKINKAELSNKARMRHLMNKPSKLIKILNKE